MSEEMSSPDIADAFRQGETTGIIKERLNTHDKMFQTMNSTNEKILAKMGLIELGLQKLNDRSISEEAARVALRESETAKRDLSEKKWTPWQRIISLLGGATAIVGTYLAIKTGVIK